MAPETQPVSRPREKRGSPSVITPRLGETSAKRRRTSGRQPAAAPAAAAPPPPPPQWRDGWEEVAENEYSPAALLVIAERQRRRQHAPGAAALAASGSRDAPKERRLRVDAAVLEGFSEAERRGLPDCMSKFREKGADARRAYCEALLAVREITDPSHPAKQSGLQQGRAHEWGLFARRALVRSTLLGELTGLVCTGEEADAAAADDPRGLGGLRADKIKSLGMTVPKDGHGAAAAGGGSERGSAGAGGWAQELVIDGAVKSCMLRFVNSHEGVRPEPNTACVEAEDVAAGTVHVFMVTVAPVAEGEELLLDYGPHFLRHIREEAQRAAALCALERQVSELQAANAELVQQTTQHQAHEQLQEQAYLDLLEEYRALQQRQQQQQVEAQAAADQRVAAAEARAAERVAAAKAGAAERVTVAEAEAGKLRRRLTAAEAALATAEAEAAAAAEREAASLTQFCSVARQREALLGAQAQAAVQQAAAQLEAKDAEIAAQRAAAEEARAALAAGQQQWEAERGQLKELLHLAQQQLGELNRLLAGGSLSSQAVAALDAATAAFDAAAAAAAGEEAGPQVGAQQQTVGAAEEEDAGTKDAIAAAAAVAAPAEVVAAVAADGTNQCAGPRHPPVQAEVEMQGATISPATTSIVAEEQHQQEPPQLTPPQQPAQQPAEAPCSSPAAEAAPPCEGAVLTAATVAAALAAQEEALQAGELLGRADLAQDALGLLGGYGSSSSDDE